MMTKTTSERRLRSGSPCWRDPATCTARAWVRVLNRAPPPQVPSQGHHSIERSALVQPTRSAPQKRAGHPLPCGRRSAHAGSGAEQCARGQRAAPGRGAPHTRSPRVPAAWTQAGAVRLRARAVSALCPCSLEATVGWHQAPHRGRPIPCSRTCRVTRADPTQIRPPRARTRTPVLCGLGFVQRKRGVWMKK